MRPALLNTRTFSMPGWRPTLFIISYTRSRRSSSMACQVVLTMVWETISALRVISCSSWPSCERMLIRANAPSTTITIRVR